MIYQLRLAVNWAKMSVYWCLAKLDIRLSTDPIPESTPYCYVADEERNEKEPEEGVLWTKPCKYYKNLGGDCIGCGFLGIVTYDEDQVKFCGEKTGMDDYVSDDYVTD